MRNRYSRLLGQRSTDMPLYDYTCPTCGWANELYAPVFGRDGMACPRCQNHLHREMAAPMGRMAGQYGKGGGPDKFTADMMGIPLKELPPALKADK